MPLRLTHDERTSIIIDGSNLNMASRSTGKIDFEKLLIHLKKNCLLVHATYCSPSEGAPGLEGFLDYLNSVGWSTERRKPKQTGYGTTGDADVQFTISGMEALIGAGSSHVILGTGDSDFIPLNWKITKKPSSYYVTYHLYT